ncbi:MAG: CoA-binding protein [Helicobacteraceae bacterium]|jgi:predicted CoA-binding protein|nr:CoA-binding protein [Helicobacteraceae bacterium]
MQTDYKEIFNGVKTIAIVGLSPDQTKASHIVARYMQANGYEIIPIYPSGETILGEKVYRTLGEVDKNVDMVVMFRKAVFADKLATEIIKRGDVKVFWLQEGIINDAALEIVKKNNLLAIQDQCVMKAHKEFIK